MEPIVKTITLTKGLITYISDEDYEFLRQFTWYSHGSRNLSYYAARGIRQGSKTEIVFLHDYVAQRMGLIGSVDHKDRDKLNNQRTNLRIATNSQNRYNNGLRPGSLTGFKGVSFDSRHNKFVAQIQILKSQTTLGHFDNPEDAARAYDRAAKRFHKEFAYLNFPEKNVD